MAISDQSPPAHHSHLFTVRLWLEVVDEQQVEVRGQVQHVLSGETRYFRDWARLVALLDAMFANLESTSQKGDHAADPSLPLETGGGCVG